MRQKRELEGGAAGLANPLKLRWRAIRIQAVILAFQTDCRPTAAQSRPCQDSAKTIGFAALDRERGQARSYDHWVSGAALRLGTPRK